MTMNTLLSIFEKIFNLRYFAIIVISLIISVHSTAQILSTFHTKTITQISDTIKIDTLALVPASIKLYFPDGKEVPDSLFTINYAKSEIIFKNLLKNSQNISISYRTFPIDFDKTVFHKNPDIKINSNGNLSNPYTYRINKTGIYDNFGTDELIKRGSISRGVSFGNNQDVVVNSNLNLQLSGKLGKDLNILAAVTDNNVPIQPEGNTQQIQDFDKVFISVFSETLKLTVGDFELTKPTGYFMLMNRKAQGIIASNLFTFSKNKTNTLKTTVSGSVSKGKYFRMTFNGTEGTQGPYRLKGAFNEPFIIIIAGSERVYIDGKQLERGQDYDYVIDYNTAELIFTAKQPITKDKRIVVEYEYSDKNYARFMLFSGNEWQFKKRKIWLNIFSEQDSKNQTLQQNLTENEKLILSQAGDNSALAVVPYITLDTAFRNDAIFYKILDTLVNTTIYDNIFVYSTNPDSAVYRLGFTYLGQGKGNYIQINSAANGRVFKWVAPLNGIMQGDYEPVRQLITPRKKNVLTTGADFALSPKLNFKYEFGTSGNDLNTFSAKDDNNNTGYAFKATMERKFLIGDTSKNKFSTGINIQQVDKRFDPVERYRSSEFERDWNLTTSNSRQDELITGITLAFQRTKTASLLYGLDYMNRQNNFTGIRNNLNGFTIWKGFRIDGKGSYLQSDETSKNTNFLRHRLSLRKDFKSIFIGIAEEQEINTWKFPNSDSLFSNSFRYDQLEASAGLSDTSKNPLSLNYCNRKDYLPFGKNLNYATNAQDFRFSASLVKNPKNMLKTDITYRILDITDSSLTNALCEDNLTGRLEHSLKIYKSVLTLNTIYETGSGLEVKKEFSYLEVPAGQGVYMWTDYNENGIKELDEFEVAMFSDQATYIRIFTPTNEFEKVYSSKLTQVANLKPESIWGNKTGIKKIVSRFSNQLAYNVDNKHKSPVLLQRIIPFSGLVPDTVILAQNKNIRNTLSFNRTNSILGIDYLYQDTRGSLLLLNGTDIRSLKQHTLKIRWNINKKISFTGSGSTGEKSFSSEYFNNRDYRLILKSSEISISFQPSVSLRITGNGKYTKKINLTGAEIANHTNTGLEIRYNVMQKGNLSLKADYIHINFKGEPSSSLGYEMLEGLLAGNNAVWMVQYQRDLSNSLQINISYNGRISQNSKAVHIGTVQMRAYF